MLVAGLQVKKKNKKKPSAKYQPNPSRFLGFGLQELPAQAANRLEISVRVSCWTTAWQDWDLEVTGLPYNKGLVS